MNVRIEGRQLVLWLALVSCTCAVPAAWAGDDDPLAPVAFLVGEHQGEGRHPYGTYQETQKGAYALGRRVIEIRTKSTMQGNTVHEDLRVISWDAKAKVLRMRQWAKDVLRVYSGTVDDKGTVTFEETAREGQSRERWRYTFQKEGEAGFSYVLHVDRGKGWTKFVSGRLGQEVKDPGKAGALGLRQYDTEIAGMRAQVHHPDGEGPYPALVFSPGGGARSFQGYRPYGRWYGSWGYITVIVAFDDDAADERAPKVSKVLDWLIEEKGREGAPLEGLVDVERLAVGGHSRGGNAAIRAARRDKRVTACLAFAPSGPSEAIEGDHAAALCAIIGDKDQFLDAAKGAAKHAKGPTYLFVIEGMSHMLEPREQTLKLVARSTAFLNFALKGDRRYEPFLTKEAPGVTRVDVGR